MTRREYIDELARPFTDSTVLIAMLTFTGLFALADAAGLLGIWLLVVTLPACSRFLIGITAARIDGRPVAPPGIELFSLVDSVWTLLPLVLIVGGALLVRAMAGTPIAASALALSLALAVPASVGVLALTRSPAAAINPLHLHALIRRTGKRYLGVPAAVLAAVALLGLLALLGAPSILVAALASYPLFLGFSLTGAVVAGSGLREEVGIPDPVEPAAETLIERDLRSRRAVLDHAYGLFSRGNRAGGLRHIEGFVDRSEYFGTKIEVFEWFFEKMLRWENAGPALALAQVFLSRLVDAGESTAAMKLIGRSLLEDERWRPLPADRERVTELASAAGRTDILTRLR